jgi:uncharacterized membrane protein
MDILDLHHQGQSILQDRATRRRELVELGVALILTFVIVRAINIYGDPQPWSLQPTLVFTIQLGRHWRLKWFPFSIPGLF